MTKYFVTSDIHSFFNEFKGALENASFDVDNSDHVLVICGDVWDRGSQALELYEFLKSIPKERRILIRGNHESLLKKLVEREYPLSHDLSNGTLDTLAYIAKEPNRSEIIKKEFKTLSKYTYEKAEAMNEARRQKWEHKLFHNRKLKEILKWIDDEWVDYYELDNFIFVHSFIPVIWNGKLSGFSEEYNPDWRNATQEEWEEARWGCPWKKVDLNKTGKTIVCGHWHTSDFWNNLVYHDNVYEIDKENPIFYDPPIPLIGLDACTALTDGVNVFVIDGENLTFYNHNGENYTNA